MNEIQLQTKVLTKTEMPESAQRVADNLLEIYSGIESFIIVKSMIETLTQSLDLMREKAIKSVHGKEEIVMGAKVTLKNTPRKYEYQGTEYNALFREVERAKNKLKDYEKVLQLSPSGVINPSTGETESSTMVSGEGTQITVTFNK